MIAVKKTYLYAALVTRNVWYHVRKRNFLFNIVDASYGDLSRSRRSIFIHVESGKST